MVREAQKQKRSDAAADAAALIDLTSELAARDYVTLDGKRYPLARAGSFGLTMRARIDGLAKRIGELEARAEKQETTPVDDAEYEDRVRELAALVLPTAPKTALAKIDTAQLVGLGIAFFVWLNRRSPLPLALTRMMSSPSPNRSRGSRASTAAS